MKKTFKFDVLKVTKWGCQNTYHKTVKAEDFKSALIKLKLGVKTFGEGGMFKGGFWIDEKGVWHSVGVNIGGHVVRYVNTVEIRVDVGDL